MSVRMNRESSAPPASPPGAHQAEAHPKCPAVAGAVSSPAGSSRVEPKGSFFMTKFQYRGLLALLLLTGFLAAPARAVDEKASQPYVVIVGIDNYHDQHILPRKHAEADARSLYDVVTSKDHLGVDAGHVKLLLGGNDAKRHS